MSEIKDLIVAENRERGTKLKGYTILIVEDEENVRDVLSSIARREGASIVEAGDGQQGLKKLKENQVDAIITDLAMPIMNGLEMIEKIREDDPNVPIVILTGENDSKAAQKGLRFGVFDLLEKPIDRGNLINRVHNAIEHHRFQMMSDFVLNSFLEEYSDLPPDVLKSMPLAKKEKMLKASLAIWKMQLRFYRPAG